MTAITDDYPATTSTAGALRIGGKVFGTLESYVDADWFAITLTAGARYAFAIAPSDYFNTPAAFGLNLYDAAGRLVMAPTYMSALTYDAPTTGTYYLSAYAPYGSLPYRIGQYTISAAVRTDADDHGASAAGAGTLVAPGLNNGAIEVSGDHDWYKFHVDGRAHYTFAAVAAEGVDPLNRLYSANFAVFSASGEKLPGFQSFDIAAAGDYYLDVSAGSTSTGSYSIRVVDWLDDYSSDDSGAGRLLPGGSVTGLVQGDSDTDRFLVPVEAGKYYTFTAKGSGGIAYLSINDTSYTQYVYLSGPSAAVQQLSFLATATGIAHIDVSGNLIAGPVPAALPYTLSASLGVAAIADVVGDTVATATRATVGVSPHSAFQGPNDVDMFKVALEAGVTYAFTLSTAANGQGQKIQFYDTDGHAISDPRSALTTSNTLTATRAGDYYVAVSSPSTLAGDQPYTLDITRPVDDFGASAATAGSLAMGARIDATLEVGNGDRDWFGVDLSAGVRYEFTFASFWIANRYGLQFRLVDAAGNALASVPVPIESGSTILPYQAITTGKLYLEVASVFYSTGAYVVSAAALEKDDYGSTPAGAGVVTPTAPASGRFQLAGDADMFKISLVAGKVYGLDVQGGTGATTLQLTDAAGAALPFAVRAGASGGVLFTAATTGDAYVTLSGASVYNYVLTEKVYDADDFAAGPNASAGLAVGASRQGALGAPNDVDWIRVHLEAGIAYAFQLFGAASGGGTLGAAGQAGFALVDSAGHKLGATLTGTTEGRLNVTPSASGDYYLVVGSATGDAMGSYTVKALQLSGDFTAPVLLSQSHFNGETGVLLNDINFQFVFSEPIQIAHYEINLVDSKGQSQDMLYPGVVVSDNTITFQHFQGFKPGSYSVWLLNNYVHDLNGNAATGLGNITFTTVLPAAAPTSGDDLLSGGLGTRIDGGAGIDTVLYYPEGNFNFSQTGGTITFSDASTGLTDTLVNVERLLINGYGVAFDADGHGGQAYRLYQAAFARTPDRAGIGYWLAKMDKGLSLHDVAQQFVGSAEFTALYGAAPTDNDFIAALYSNVLHRAPDVAGLDYWVAAMHSGNSRADALEQFSESAENQAALVATISSGFGYVLY